LREEDFADFCLRPKQNPDLHPFLSSRHLQVQDLVKDERVTTFVQRAMAKKQTYRRRLGELKRALPELYANDPEVRTRLSLSWQEILKKLKI
jgi:hypothetical protein